MEIKGWVLAEIKYDPSRGNGHYYASVNYEVSRNGTSTPVEREVVLNGPGTNKAIKKIERTLRSEGFNADKWHGRSIPISISNKIIED